MSMDLAVRLLAESTPTIMLFIAVNQVIRCEEGSIECSSEQSLLFSFMPLHLGCGESRVHVRGTCKRLSGLSNPHDMLLPIFGQSYPKLLYWTVHDVDRQIILIQKQALGDPSPS